ncbi:putative glycosyl transferase [compost metagenome]
MRNKRKPNIWYIHPYAGGPGVGRYSRPYFLAQHWIEFGLRATVFSASFHHLLDRPQNDGAKIIGGVPYEFVKGRNYTGNGLGRLLNMMQFSWNFFRNSSEYASRYGKPDVIIASSPHPYSFFAARSVAKKYGAKIFFEVRDLWPLSLVELGGVSANHPVITFTEWVEKVAYKYSDRVVSLLPLTAPHMIDRGLAVERWSYVPNGIDRQESQHASEVHPIIPLAREWRKNGSTIFIYAGALGRPNHVDSLVKAMSILKSQAGNSIKAIIVGKGEAESDLKKLIIELGLDEDVRIFGQIPKAQIVELLGEVDAGFISLRPEPIFRFGISPNKLFDYMLAALPVVFAVHAGNDPVREADCGYSVAPGDAEAVALAMRNIASLSEVQRREMGNRGRSYVLKNHDYAALAASYVKLFEPS